MYRVGVFIERVVAEAVDGGEELFETALLTVVHRRARPHRGNHLVSSRCHSRPPFERAAHGSRDAEQIVKRGGDGRHPLGEFASHIDAERALPVDIRSAAAAA